MLHYENKVDTFQNKSLDIEILEQGLSQLPEEVKVQFRDYLQNLVGMQNSMVGVCQDEVKERCSDNE